MKKATNPILLRTVRTLRRKAKEFNAPVWRALADQLEKSKHNRCKVNVSRINRYTTEDDYVIVPGKTLGSGILDHKVSVAAFSFSDTAKRKIEASGGECLTFTALLQKNPEGENLKIIG
ncbi:MAG: 50S ribosomal protein L18e [Candidatus Bathyarchaeota archaeon]|nr:MAG: 50S ribosomal protein L18e [Candidatus Bathyarchaeota archaeon]